MLFISCLRSIVYFFGQQYQRTGQAWRWLRRTITIMPSRLLPYFCYCSLIHFSSNDHILLFVITAHSSLCQDCNQCSQLFLPPRPPGRPVEYLQQLPKVFLVTSPAKTLALPIIVTLEFHFFPKSHLMLSSLCVWPTAASCFSNCHLTAPAVALLCIFQFHSMYFCVYFNNAAWMSEFSNCHLTVEQSHFPPTQMWGRLFGSMCRKFCPLKI